MGVIRWLDRIGPETWSRACERLSNAGIGLLDPQAATGFLRDFGKEPTGDFLDMLADTDDDELRSLALNSLLEAAVTDKEWHLDKSLNQIGSVIRALPDASPLLKIVDFEGLDVEPPEPCRVIDSGLFGCCTPEALRDCLEVVRRYPTPADVAAALERSPRGLLSRVTGRASRAASAKARISDDYHSQYWLQLVEAIDLTVSNGDYLGLGMSP